MNNEKFDRKMAFIVEQQAQAAEIVAQTSDVVARLANGTLEGFKDVNTKINALVDSQIRLNDSQSRTDESLRNLIAVVDRHFSEGRNGK